MAKSRQQKSSTIEKLVDAFKRAKSVAFANYKGITVAQADELRKQARAAGVEYVVAKKTLVTKAAKEAGYEVDAKRFEGMIGAAFGTADEVAPAKVIGDLSKKTPITLVGGIFDGAAVDAAKVTALSKLPGKKELLGTVVGTIYAPVSAFVRLLNAIREKRDAGTPVVEAPAKEETPVAPEAAPEAKPETAEAAPAEAPVESAPESKPESAPEAQAPEAPAPAAA
jgi:large subunit ribosomal protein L10